METDLWVYAEEQGVLILACHILDKEVGDLDFEDYECAFEAIAAELLFLGIEPESLFCIFGGLNFSTWCKMKLEDVVFAQQQAYAECMGFDKKFKYIRIPGGWREVEC